MNKTERAGAPALGNALGYFAALYLIDKVDWLTGDNSELAVAMMGTVCIHLLIEARSFRTWFATQVNKWSAR